MNLEEIWKWWKRKQNTWMLEAVAAVLLIAVLGIAGIMTGESEQERTLQAAGAEQKQAQEEAEQQGAAETEMKEPTEEVIADGQYPIMGQSSVTTEEMVSYFQASGKPYRQDTESTFSYKHPQLFHRQSQYFHGVLCQVRLLAPHGNNRPFQYQYRQHRRQSNQGRPDHSFP